IDRDALADFFGGTPTNQWATFGTTIYDPALDEMFPHDPGRARELLAEAGFADGFQFTITHTNRPATNEAAQIVQAQLAEAGIRAELESFDVASVVDKCFVNKQCDSVLGTAQGSFDLAA